MFHSEYGQDRWLSEHVFRGQRDGTFVEFGALDGLLHSNSLVFEEHFGWTGLCVEANPALHERLRRNRPKATCFGAAIWDRPGIALFEQIRGGLFGWSGMVETIEPQHRERIEATIPASQRWRIEVPCITLEQALTDAGLLSVDYLSIDVEGAELKILSAFPFDRFDIRVLGVEDNFGNPALDELMARQGYEKIARIGPDNIWQRRDAGH